MSSEEVILSEDIFALWVLSVKSHSDI